MLNYSQTPLYFTLLIILLVGCDSTDNINIPGSELGTVNMQITDDPFPGSEVSSAVVTISQVEIRSVNGGNGEGAFTTISTEAQTFNLLELTNDVVAPLASAEIEAGLYNQVRLVVSDASITLKDGQTFDLKVPSGAESGIKVNVSPAVEVAGGISAELLLDFDVASSFVPRGQIESPGFNGFIFKPVVRAANLSTAGRINGEVFAEDSTGTSMEVSEAQVWVTQSDSVFATTFSEEDGSYALIGLPEGQYNLHATKNSYDTTSVEGVNVTAGNKIQQNLEISSSTK